MSVVELPNTADDVVGARAKGEGAEVLIDHPSPELDSVSIISRRYWWAKVR